MPTGNPISRNPLLHKGGAHRRCRSGERQRDRQQLKAAMDQWDGDIDDLALAALSNHQQRTP